MPGTACPTPKDLETADKFIEKEFIDPKLQFTLFEGRIRLMNLKQPPTRIQIGDEKKEIVDYAIITPKQISLLGKKQGSTVLNLWFADPADKNKEIPVSYLVRVITDPEEKVRQDIRYKRLTDQINCAFPDSRVCLTLVGDKLMVTGQAKDVALPVDAFGSTGLPVLLLCSPAAVSATASV